MRLLEPGKERLCKILDVAKDVSRAVNGARLEIYLEGASVATGVRGQPRTFESSSATASSRIHHRHNCTMGDDQP
jgi:hypothetical protein